MYGRDAVGDRMLLCIGNKHEAKRVMLPRSDMVLTLRV